MHDVQRTREGNAFVRRFASQCAGAELSLALTSQRDERGSEHHQSGQGRQPANELAHRSPARCRSWRRHMSDRVREAPSRCSKPSTCSVPWTISRSNSWRTVA